MKNLSLSFLTLTLLLNLTPANAYTSLAGPSFSFIKYEVYPIPSDDKTILSFGKSSENQLPPKNWSFLVWNLHKGVDESFTPDYLSLSYGRDIIMNQEFYLGNIMIDVFSYLQLYRLETATSFFTGNEKIRTGVANISKVSPTFTQFLRTLNREPVVLTPKITLITSYPIESSKKNLTVVNIHGINFVSTDIFRIELDRIYKQIKDIPSPLVFAGDFNTWNLERITILNKYIKKLKLKGAIFQPDNRTTFNGYHLDHFFYSSDIKVKSARADGYYLGSDHKPLTVEVEYISSNDDQELIPSEEELEDDLQIEIDTSVF